MTSVTSVLLPVPPSANALHMPVGRGRMVKSPAYIVWIEQCTCVLRAQYVIPRITENMPIGVYIDARINRNRDLDNIIKPSIDLLVQSGMIPDDRWVDWLSATRAGKEEPMLSPGWMHIRWWRRV